MVPFKLAISIAITMLLIFGLISGLFAPVYCNVLALLVEKPGCADPPAG